MAVGKSNPHSHTLYKRLRLQNIKFPLSVAVKFSVGAVEDLIFELQMLQFNDIIYINRDYIENIK